MNLFLFKLETSKPLYPDGALQKSY
ncbi:uncharacterized protein METZ01_LOCUS347342, partial [marine metagenome]